MVSIEICIAGRVVSLIECVWYKYLGVAPRHGRRGLPHHTDDTELVCIHIHFLAHGIIDIAVKLNGHAVGDYCTGTSGLKVGVCERSARDEVESIYLKEIGVSGERLHLYPPTA